MTQVLTLDSQGTPLRWASWQSAVILQCKDLVGWSLGEQEVKYGGVSRMTGEVSTIIVPSILSIKGKHFKRQVPRLTNQTLFGRDLHTCAYCGHEFSEKHLTRDHVIPTSKGGANSWMNCVSACKKCNNKKDDKLISEFGRELLFLPYVPDTSEKLILENRRILADQMEFLKNYLPARSRVLSKLS